MSKNMEQRVAVRLPGEIARALDKYCEDNYLTGQRSYEWPLINWSHWEKYLKEQRFQE